MPDPFTNARPYYDVVFPSSGDSFLNVVTNLKNALQGLGSMDLIPLQPRAHSPGDMRIMVRGRDASSFYNPLYAGDADKHLFFNSGDTTAMTAPNNNPRLDIVYLTASGDIRIVTGTEAATPTLPSLSPSGDTRIPVCAIYHKTTAVKIVNFEDKDSNSGDSYIYQDLRPFLRAAGLGGVTLSSTAALSVTGDNAAGAGTTSARTNHTHQGVHTMRAAGSGDLFGDVEIYGPSIRQEGRRMSIGGVVGFSHQQLANRVAGTTTIPFDDTPPLITEGDEYLFVIHRPKALANQMLVTVSINLCEATDTGANCAVVLWANSTLIKVAHSTIVAGTALLTPEAISFMAVISVTSLNAIRFSVRAGLNNGTLVMNGNNAGGLYGGTAFHSVITVEEIHA